MSLFISFSPRNVVGLQRLPARRKARSLECILGVTSSLHLLLLLPCVTDCEPEPQDLPAELTWGKAGPAHLGVDWPLGSRGSAERGGSGRSEGRPRLRQEGARTAGWTEGRRGPGTWKVPSPALRPTGQEASKEGLAVRRGEGTS